jgi:methionine synthase II (cobalamin-independent)
LSRRIRASAYAAPGDLVRALARVLNFQVRALASAGAEFMQIDEPFLAGYPDQADLAVEAVNIVVEGVPATWARHVCYGNRYARPSWEGHYDFLFPAVTAARVDQAEAAGHGGRGGIGTGRACGRRVTRVATCARTAGARAGLVVWLRNRPGFFGDRVIVRRDGAWESPH